MSDIGWNSKKKRFFHVFLIWKILPLNRRYETATLLSQSVAVKFKKPTLIIERVFQKNFMKISIFIQCLKKIFSHLFTVSILRYYTAHRKTPLRDQIVMLVSENCTTKTYRCIFPFSKNERKRERLQLPKGRFMINVYNIKAIQVVQKVCARVCVYSPTPNFQAKRIEHFASISQ